MTRVSRAALLKLANELSGTEREILQTVARFGLVSHTSLHVLFFDGVPADRRQGRRVLARLCEADALARLQRRIGGKRAGSSGFVYRLGPVGQRLVAYWNGEGLPRGRRLPEPGTLFVRHKLSISAIYVELVQAQRRGLIDLLEFTTEPDCWRIYTDAIGSRAFVKPDAFARIGQGAYEDRLFIESDLGTEGRGTLATKVQTYVNYYRAGVEQNETGVFPRVLWLVPTAQRSELLVDICSQLPAEDWSLFAVISRDRLLAFVSDERAGNADVQRDALIGGAR